MDRPWTPTLALGLLTTATAASGQVGPDDRGPLVVGTPRESWKGFDLRRLDAAFEYRFQYQYDTVEQGGQRVTTRQTRHRELLDLSGEGSIGHRNLLDITGSVQLGLEDIFNDSDADPLAGHEQDFVNLYDVNALLFGASSLPTDIYARREQSILDRPFSGTVEDVLTEEGIGTRFQSDRFYGSLRYFHRDESLTGGFGDIDTHVRQDSATLTNGIVFGQSSRLDTTYTFDHISESQADGFADSYDRNDLNTVHTLAFGGEGTPHELRSALRYYSQGGLQSQEDLRWDERLTLRHTPRLESRYDLTADVRDVRGEKQQLLRAASSVKHQLFDSLTSVGTVGAQRLQTPGDFTSDDVFVSAQFDYTKRVPLGRLDASAGGAFDAQSNSDRGSSFGVVNESYLYTDGFPVVIPRRNIVPGSVVVTPPAGFPVYRENVDYTLTILPDRAEIRGIVGGALVNGQTIFVSYDVGPEPAFDVNTTTTNFSVRYTLTEGTLQGLGLYGTYRTTDHSQSGGQPLVFDDLNDLLLGVEYRRFGLDARYEYNVHDSTFDPYTVQRLQGIYTYSSGLGSAVSAEWTHELVDYTEPANRVTIDRGALRATFRLDPSLDLNASLDYRNEDSSLNGTSQGFDQSIGLAYRRGQTSTYATFRNSTLDGQGSNQTSQFFEFGIRRTF